MLMGALGVRHLVDGRPVDQEFLLEYVDSVVLPALGVAGRTTAGASSPVRA